MVPSYRGGGAGFILALICYLAVSPFVSLQAQEAPASQAAATRSLGTVKAISGKAITLSTDAGSEINVVLQEGARLLRVEPGEKDLKNAVPLTLEEVQPGDRVLVRGKIVEDGKTLLAASLIAMKKMDIAQKQAHEREAWQKTGVGGLVNTVDPANGIITISTNAMGANKNVAVHVSRDTQLRRYSADSIKFDEAKAAPIEEIKVGDQLRARGSRSPDGSELAAVEVVSGSFRNVAGTIISVDVSAGTVTVNDLATKKVVAIKVTGDSQLRKLLPAMAQRIAARLKATNGEAPATATEQRPGGNSQPSAANGANPAQTGGRPEGAQGGLGGSDLQQAISRMPAATLADLNKGDAVMIVGTGGTQDSGIIAITLLAGVEPILEASPKSGQSILTPWNLGSLGGEGATP